MQQEALRHKKIKKVSEADRKKEKIQKSIDTAKRSTASMGKYNEKGEKVNDKKKNPREGPRVHFSSTKAELSRNKDVLRKILG